jgi:hypothetical protein
MSTTALLTHVSRQLEDDVSNERVVRTPHGLYLPFSLLGEDGYAVVHENSRKVVTIMPTEYCKEVDKLLGEQLYDH